MVPSHRLRLMLVAFPAVPWGTRTLFPRDKGAGGTSLHCTTSSTSVGAKSR
jgi:hypothetical protein